MAHLLIHEQQMALQNAHILPHPLKPSPLYLKKIKVCIFYKKQNVFHQINDEIKFSSCTKSRHSKENNKSVTQVINMGGTCTVGRSRNVQLIGPAKQDESAFHSSCTPGITTRHVYTTVTGLVRLKMWINDVLVSSTVDFDTSTRKGE